MPSEPIFQAPLYFLENQDNILKKQFINNLSLMTLRVSIYIF
jgi:hypothetical protein